MPTARLLFLSAALEELDEAFGWYLDRSPQAAAAFLKELERAVALVAETPAVWPAFHLGTHSIVFGYVQGQEFFLEQELTV